MAELDAALCLIRIVGFIKKSYCVNIGFYILFLEVVNGLHTEVFFLFLFLFRFVGLCLHFVEVML